MALLDGIFSTPDLDSDPLAIPDEREKDDQALHVRNDGRRYAILLREIWGIKRWMFWLSVILVINGTIDVKAMIAKFFVPA